MIRSRKIALLLLSIGIVATSSPALAAPTVGEALFRQRCQACHSVTTPAISGVGPSLRGLVGRKAASTVFNYSPALKASTLVWTKPNLDRFIAAPAKTVPGTRMFIALPDAKQRAAVIDYLSTVK